MSGIFGIVHLDGGPLDPAGFQGLIDAMRPWGPDGITTAWLGSAGFGQALLCSTPESRHEAMPVVDRAAETLVVAAARLDNRDEMCDALEIPGPLRANLSDGHLVARACARWGEQTPRRLLGDWSFAVWNSRQRRLLLARDQLGLTGLHYHHRHPFLAFASDATALLALPQISRAIDEPQLARYLTMSPGDDWSHTYWRDISSLLPGTVLSASPTGARLTRYWRLEEAKPVSASSEQDYLDGFLHHFREAVRRRLRSLRPVATTLSAGLDSGSVTALAAQILGETGQGITAFTSVPRFPAAVPGGLADEWPLAHAVAERFHNIEHVALSSAHITPLAAIRRFAELSFPPVPGPNHLYWITDIYQEAQRRGCGVLLTGGLGNGGVSWSGGRDRIFFLFAQGQWRAGRRALDDWRAYRACSWRAVLRSQLLRPLLSPVRVCLRSLLSPSAIRRGEHSFILPVFAQGQRRLGTIPAGGCGRSWRLPRPPREERLLALNLNAAAAGPLWHAFGATFGLEVRDPTTDVTLLEYCLGVPEGLHTAGGGDRMMIRRGMAGILPDEVRWNTLRGRQSADVVPRLLEHPGEMARELHCMRKSSIVKEYLDLDAMERAWQAVLAFTPERLPHGVSLGLTRAILVGRFLIHSPLPR